MSGPAEPLFQRSAPSVQAALDLFAGQWASRMPDQLGPTRAGEAGLFADPRLDWACAQFSELGQPLAGARVLELGPLEGAHTWMLRQREPREIVAVEANGNAYLKCLLVKELLQLDRVRFLYGDAIAYLQDGDEPFDVGVACGILYHLVNPVELIEQLSRRCRSVFLWTVYFDPAFNAAHPDRAAGAGPAHQVVQGGFQHTLHRHDYGSGAQHAAFWGGSSGHCHWMERDDILGALRHFGFTRQIVHGEANPRGSALAVVATRG